MSSTPTLAQQVAQYVIDNRFPKSEHDKVTDSEMYHQILDMLSSPSPLQGAEPSYKTLVQQLLDTYPNFNKADIEEKVKEIEGVEDVMQGLQASTDKNIQSKENAETFLKDAGIVNDIVDAVKPKVEGVEEAAVESAEQILKRIINDHPFQGFEDEQIKMAVEAMHEYASQFQSQSKGVGMELFDDLIEDIKANIHGCAVNLGEADLTVKERSHYNGAMIAAKDILRKAAELKKQYLNQPTNE